MYKHKRAKDDPYTETHMIEVTLVGGHADKIILTRDEAIELMNLLSLGSQLIQTATQFTSHSGGDKFMEAYTKIAQKGI